MNPVTVRTGILRASGMVCDRIPQLARKVESVDDLVNIATVSTGGDKGMAKTIAAVFERVGMDAKVPAVPAVPVRVFHLFCLSITSNQPAVWLIGP